MSLNILWYDDDVKVFDETKPAFNHVIDLPLEYHDCTTYDDFMGIYKDLKRKIDFIFLDIDLGTNKKNGIEIYKEIRSKYKNLIVVFLSGKLASPNRENEIISLVETDDFLFTLPLPFPSKRKKHFFDQKVAKPINKIFEYYKQSIFNVDLESFVNLGKSDRVSIYNKAFKLQSKNLQKLFKSKQDIQWVGLSDDINNIVLEGRDFDNLLGGNIYKTISERNIVIFFYKRSDNDVGFDQFFDYNNIISYDRIPAEVLEIDHTNNELLLNCLIDVETRNFEIRKFDLEPFLFLESNKRVRFIFISILTLPEQRIFSFYADDTNEIFKAFEMKSVLKEEDDFSFLFPTEKT